MILQRQVKRKGLSVNHYIINFQRYKMFIHTMIKEHSVIIIPGLGDDVIALERLTNHWQKSSLIPVIHSVGWRDKEKDFYPKLNRILVLIDQLVANDNVVSLIGTSAGGSAVLNAFIERRDVVNKVINVCGRLRKGPLDGLRSFQSKTSSSPAFAQSVILAEEKIGVLSNQERQRIMTVRPLFGDELVPSSTTTIDGAVSTIIPTTEHMLSIGAALSVFSAPLIRFLLEE